MGRKLRSGVGYLRDRVQARVAIARLLPLAGTRLAVSAVGCNLFVGLAPVGFVIATSVLVGRLPGAVHGGWASHDGRAVVSAIAAAGVLL
ncbi:MAG TPA: hypothetical protein VK672_08625, partial [Solirubrobacteraceae bacterium]|nr:hypothetical protein [Solirubrobacteraceae bacterium]